MTSDEIESELVKLEADWDSGEVDREQLKARAAELAQHSVNNWLFGGKLKPEP